MVKIESPAEENEKLLFLENKNYLHRVIAPWSEVQGRKEEIELLEETLRKKRMLYAILIGEPGVGKTVIVQQVSKNMANDYIFAEFDIPGAVAGTKYRGEFEKRICDIVNYVVKFNSIKLNKKVVLFIDEIHTIYKAGSSEGGINAANMLKPYLANGEIMIIGATTPEEYETTIKLDGALTRRLSPIYIGELSKENVLAIASNFAGHSMARALIEYTYATRKDIPKTWNPDISIEIIDRCLAKEKLIGEVPSKEMVDEVTSYMKKGESK